MPYNMNPTSRECYLRKWVYRASKEALGKIAAALQQRRYAGHAGDPFSCACTFVVYKEKGLVFGYWPSKGAAILIALILGFGLVRGCEVVAGVQCPVAKELIDRSMKTIRSRL